MCRLCHIEVPVLFSDRNMSQTLAKSRWGLATRPQLDVAQQAQVPATVVVGTLTSWRYTNCMMFENSH